ncbi:MAG: hypothetical protein IKC03_06385 [Oscillospiraceae bacterium]|nr:hypothetical protein [Oscillospiraceae bacterium]
MRSVYIVFSATPYKMGRLIRTVLHNTYNHISLSFDADLSTMYTFARFHVNTPFYGGFVSESPRRYRNAGRDAQIKVCRVSLTEEQFCTLHRFVLHMEQSSQRYIYNMYSALFAPLHIRLLIHDSYTCTEFVGDALSVAGLDIPRGAFHSLQKLEETLDSCMIYEGSCAEYTQFISWGNDHFPERIPTLSGTVATARTMGQLTLRGVSDLYSYVRLPRDRR